MKKFIVVFCLLVPFGALAMILRYMVVEPERPSALAAVPINIGDWSGKDYPIDDATASVLQATETLVRDYTDPAGDYVGVYIGYFRDQKYGSQIHSPRHCLPGGGWVVASLDQVPFNFGGRPITVNRMTITKKNLVSQMFYWFHTRSGDLTSEYSLKFDLVKNSLLLSPTDAVIIRVTVPQINQKPEECQKVAEKFMQDAIGDVRKSLPFTTI